MRDVPWDMLQGLPMGVAWISDGQALIVTASTSANSRILRVDLQGNLRTLLEQPPQYVFLSPRMSPDGHRLAFGQSALRSNVWLLEP